VIIFTGANRGVKPFATSAAFGPAKFAMRGLAQVMGRDLQPQGIHVAYVNADRCAIDMPASPRTIPAAKRGRHAEAVCDRGRPTGISRIRIAAHVAEVDVRPFKESGDSRPDPLRPESSCLVDLPCLFLP